MKKTVLWGLSALLTATLAQGEPLHYGLVSLSDSVIREITRDQMVLVLQIEEQGKDRQTVSNAVTRKVNAVLQEAGRHRQFNTTLQSRSAWPLTDYVQGRRINKGWQDQATIRLESKDMAALNAFAAKVQNQAAIGNIQYTVSTETLQAGEAELTREALKRFNTRAALITRNLGGSAYKVVQLTIGNSNDSSAPPQAYYALAAAAPERSAPAQDSAPGQEQLRLTVGGQIQIQGLR